MNENSSTFFLQDSVIRPFLYTKFKPYNKQSIPQHLPWNQAKYQNDHEYAQVLNPNNPLYQL